MNFPQSRLPRSAVKVSILQPYLPEILAQKVWKRLRREHFNKPLKCVSVLRTTARSTGTQTNVFLGAGFISTLSEHSSGPRIREKHSPTSSSCGSNKDSLSQPLVKSSKFGGTRQGSGLRGGDEHGKCSRRPQGATSLDLKACDSQWT